MPFLKRCSWCNVGYGRSAMERLLARPLMFLNRESGPGLLLIAGFPDLGLIRPEWRSLDSFSYCDYLKVCKKM